jgi:3-oxoacyl-[acyl-carrier protein] reductase
MSTSADERKKAMISLKDKVTLITGASRGIGAAAAVMFAQAGSHVIINYRNDDKAAGDVRQRCLAHGVKAVLARADIADRTSVDAMVADAVARFGRIDVLVNNAGVWEHNPIDGMDDARLRRTLDVNLLGTFYPTTAVVPYMKKQRSGNIILISSTAGQRGEAFHSPYAATKGAIISLTKSLAPELIEYNIRVNCVAPGWVDTDMSHEALVGPERGDILSKIPMRRAGTAEELAGPILFLASDLSTFITGEILNVNGGAVLCG